MSRRRNRRDAGNDKRTKKGKVYAGSNGKSRPRKPGGEKGPVDPCRGRVRPLFSPTDWRNGSASDSSPEGYVFESRIGHWNYSRGDGRRYTTQVPHAPRVGRAPGPGHVRRGGRRRQDGGQAEGRDHPRGHHGRGDAVLGSPSVLNTTFYLASPAPSTGTSWSWPWTTTTPRPPWTRSAGAFGEEP